MANKKKKKLHKITLAYVFAGVMFFVAFVAFIFRPDLSKIGNNPTQAPGTTATPALSNGASPTSGANATSTPTPTPTSTPSPTPTPLEPLVQNKGNEIEELVINYYNAKLEMTAEALEPYVSNIETINISELKKDYSLITSLSNFKVYTLSGAEGLEYVVFVSREMQLVTIDVPSPEFSILTLVRTTPDENGETKLLVNTDSLTEAQNEFINEVLTRSNFLSLYSSELKKTFEAIKSSEKLAKVWYSAKFAQSFESFDDFEEWLTESEFEDFVKLIGSGDDSDSEDLPDTEVVPEESDKEPTPTEEPEATLTPTPAN